MNETLHPSYGGCDGFGPDGRCSECTRLIQRDDGTVVSTVDEMLVFKPFSADDERAIVEMIAVKGSDDWRWLQWPSIRTVVWALFNRFEFGRAFERSKFANEIIDAIERGEHRKREKE